MNAWIIAAAALSGITTLIHFFAGGKAVPRALLDADDIDAVAKLTNYFCWHIATLVLAGVTIGFAYVAVYPAAIALLVAMSGLCAACTLLNIGIILRYRVSPIAMPQWILLGGMALLGFAGYCTF